MNRMCLPFLALALLLPGPALAGAPSKVAIQASRLCVQPSVESVPLHERPSATVEVVAGTYAAVGLACKDGSVGSAVLERSASGWRSVATTAPPPEGNPFALHGVPAAAAAALWSEWKAAGNAAYVATSDASDVAAVRKVAKRDDVGWLYVRMAAPWALIIEGTNGPGAGAGQVLYHKVHGTWTRVFGSGGTLEAFALSERGVPYAIARRLATYSRY